jgi:hypothetical protein
MRNSRYRVIGLVLAVFAAIITLGSLTACKPDPALQPDENGQTTIGNALLSTGSPWGMLAGTAINIIASTFIAKGVSKGAVQKKDLEDYTDDDVFAMHRRMAAMGLIKPPAPPT